VDIAMNPIPHVNGVTETVTRHRESPPDPYDMVRALDEALHGSTWARTYSPQLVWAELLAEVSALASLRRALDQLTMQHAPVIHGGGRR
jgi:hypothetical protein